MAIGSRAQAGFTYIGLLIAVVFFGLGSVGAARLLAATERAEREAELLFIGHQFRQAICSYLQSGPSAGKYPASISDLLQDPRQPTTKRHLRRLFVDPITGTTDWGLVNAPEGGIMGVYSLSDREPQKRANFDLADADMAMLVQTKLALGQQRTSATVLRSNQAEPLDTAAYSYSDWKFVCRPAVSGGARQPAGGG
jgi:type II secretory pathway pseudopilin PulG